MEKNNEFEKTIDKVKDILGEDFKSVLYEDIKQYHPNLTAITNIPVDAQDKKILEDITTDVAYHDFAQYYPKAFLIFIGKLEQYVIETIGNEIRKGFCDNTDLTLAEREYDLDVINQAIANYNPIALKEENKPEITYSDLKAYTVSFYASGYTGTFNYRVVAKDLDAAKAMWENYVKSNPKINYVWEKAMKGETNHYGGYVTWKESERENLKEGCDELPYDAWNTGSDHLWD